MDLSVLPVIIQGGMGIGVSDWRLARAVCMCGHMGVVSGTAVDYVLVRRLQDGDVGGHMRRAMEKFPIPQVAADVLRQFFRPAGRPPGTPYALFPMYRHVANKARDQLAMLGAFVEVHLAKDGHRGPVGVNLLTKLQLPNLALLYGAMLAQVDFVLMGAGIPREIPGALDALAQNRSASLRLEVTGPPAESVEELTLDPRDHWDGTPPEVRRPRFIPIVSSNALATMLARKGSSKIDGLVIEGPTAGGHNAPPRGEKRLNARGEPVYGARDHVDLAKIRELGIPFWLAGGRGSPQHLREAHQAGAAGVQVGTLFAFCDESGLTEDLKRSVLTHALRGELEVYTDPLASPTGYPFKVVRWNDNPAAGVTRERLCDLGGLRTAYRTAQGTINYRCPGEPVEAYVSKGGDAKDAAGRQCLCNALLANIGLGQVRSDGGTEPPLLTSGDDLESISTFLSGRSRYSAADVIDYLLPPAA